MSSHHIAFQRLPKPSTLFVGARVVVKLGPDHSYFTPGILAEVPSRKNRMRSVCFSHNALIMINYAYKTCVILFLRDGSCVKMCFVFVLQVPDYV